MTLKLSWLTAQPVAHRGYHDLNKAVWENTLSAFSRAIEAGFAIECDVQLAADSVPVIFHDDDMARLTGIKGDVRERTSAELSLLAVGQTGDRVPTLKQLLTFCAGKVPLVIELLSPARRPVQTTADLPGFWASSYADVRRDLRGRYPKHPWPEDPAAAAPTTRAKPRGA